MDIASIGVAMSQSLVQQNLAVSVMKMAAQEQQSVANMVAAAASNLGRLVDIKV
jgi:hypothetical protein